jgi:hypothetical protein
VAIHLPTFLIHKEAIMIKIVQYTKYNNSFFFFAEGNNKGMSTDYVKALLDTGMTNLSQERFNKIVGA